MPYNFQASLRSISRSNTRIYVSNGNIVLSFKRERLNHFESKNFQPYTEEKNGIL